MIVVKAEYITRIIHLVEVKIITENMVPVVNVDLLTSY